MNQIGLGILFSGLILVSMGWAFDAPNHKAADTKITTSSIDYANTLLVQLRVHNLDRAIHFYKDVMGFDLVLRNDELRWAKISTGIPGVIIGLGEGEDVLGSGTVSLNIGVVDIKAARKKLEKRGVQFRADTITIPNVVKLSDLIDPDGNKIRLAQKL